MTYRIHTIREPKPYQINLDERELNTIMAALQFWARAGLQCIGDDADEASDAYKVAAGNWPKEDMSLSREEVDALMNRIKEGD